ncbi:MAG: UDP-3-O-(3-hydroxymyristoyl)glucosamine N-acyltransferase [Flavobacteriales bacterium]|nr:UDP-3-O-(3-hydroxymyristoyl)glucosamine N-acyltransferase [Flavobacteriales bacterium]|tara:strand:- start:1088 stop:2110 length:1023 start_codon:yes stop_codon:yes gene_type:complete
MKIKANEICKIIKGTLIGDPNINISSFSNIENAKKGNVTFLADMRYKKYIDSTEASLIIVPRINIKTEKTIIKVDNPVERFIEILNLFSPKKTEKREIAQSAKINQNSKISQNVFIGENSVIQENTKINSNCIINSNTFIGKNTKIGSNTQIGPNVTIYPNTEIGENCIIHAGVVIGSEGFGFIQKKDGIIKIPQIGKTIIKNNVEIGSNTTIDRGTFNNTTINSGVKLDNLIQVGHNVTIGENTIIAAQTGIAGSTKIGKNCMIGGQVAIADHITIGNNVKIAGKSGVIKNVPNNKILQGHLAFNIKDFQKSYIHFKNLTKIVSDIEQLKEKNKIANNN